MKFIKILIPILIIAIIAMGVIVYLNIGKEESVTKNVEYNSVEKICELATLKCYYHNVATKETTSNKILNVGYKKVWIEYSGIVEMGIKDASQIQINSADENGVVKIYVPNAEPLKVYSDDVSINDTVYDKGAFTKITSEDKAEAYSIAQAEMLKKSSEDTVLLKQANVNAKELLQQYVINVSKQIGQEVTVEWIEEPIINK